MHNPLEFQGKIYKDALISTMKFKMGFWRRVFSPEVEVRITVYTEDIVPPHKADYEARPISYWRMFVAWVRRHKNKGKGLQHPAE